MSDFRETFHDAGFQVGQAVASHYLTNRILTFHVASIGSFVEAEYPASWKKHYPDLKDGDVILSLQFTGEDRTMHVPPKYHQVVPFPEAKAA